MVTGRAAGETRRRPRHSTGAPWSDRTLAVTYPGRVGYPAALEMQATLIEQRRKGRIPDTLLLLEHPHVITFGSAGGRGHLLISPGELAARGIGVHQAGRGGDVTYHGPGQLVGYPILDLKPDRKDLHAYLRSLEAVLMGALRTLGIEAGRDEGATGVWAGGEKVAAIGIRVSSGWITSHGFALNANTDLSMFSAIVPCGLHGRRVTSASRLLGREVTPGAAAPALVAAMAEEFGYGRVDDPAARGSHPRWPPPSGSAVPRYSPAPGGANSK